MENNFKKILKHSGEIEKWKDKTCFNVNRSLCKTCCSGGIMLGSFCSDMEEEYKEFTNKIISL